MADVAFSLIHCCSTSSDTVSLLVDLYEMLTSLAFSGCWVCDFVAVLTEAELKYDSKAKRRKLLVNAI